MNVRVSYSTELSQVPAKICEMLSIPDKMMIDQSRKIDLITDVLQESGGKYAATALDMIDELRKALALIDQELMESQQILEGYVQAVNPQPEPEPQPVVETKRLKDIPRGKEAVTYSDADVMKQAMAAMEEASGELPNLEDNNV